MNSPTIDLASLLSGICFLAGTLGIFAIGIIYVMGLISEDGAGVRAQAMIPKIIVGVAISFAIGAWVAAQSFDLGL